MRIVYNEEKSHYEIIDLSWNEVYEMYIAIKKIVEKIENTKYENEYYRQESKRLISKYNEILNQIEASIPFGMAEGLNEMILNKI